MSYNDHHDTKILYNIAISLLGLNKYPEAIECFKAIREPFPEMISPYLITMAICGKEEFKFSDIPDHLQELISQMRLPDKMLLFYLCNQYQKVVEIEDGLTEQWSLSKNEWAILIDSFLKHGESKLIENIIQRELSHYTSTVESRFYKTVVSLCYDAQKRQKVIKYYLHTLCFPQIQLCSYYGCDFHNTPWEI
jgi:tetratricopeptide (TPR) repeat protein